MKKKIIIITVLALIAIGGGVAYYLWNKPKETAKDVTPTFILSADELATEFVEDSAKAFEKYAKDAVSFEIQGTIDSTYVNDGNETVIVLGTKQVLPVSCYFIPEQADNGNPSQFNKNDEVVIKGYCGGLNGDLFPEIQMTKCYIRKK
jgi:ABC-type glycerol-3-phosphate transport system substrate-binding protein